MDRKVVVIGTGLILFSLLGVFFLYTSPKSEEATSISTTISVVPTAASNTGSANRVEEVTINSTQLAKNYFVFQQSEYLKARAARRPILLFFYANWCPTCARQEPINLQAFNNLPPTNLIAFRVNYNDNDTSADEKALAQELGITYQHNFRLFDTNGTLIDSFQGDTSETVLRETLEKVN